MIFADMSLSSEMVATVMAAVAAICGGLCAGLKVTYAGQVASLLSSNADLKAAYAGQIHDLQERNAALADRCTALEQLLEHSTNLLERTVNEKRRDAGEEPFHVAPRALAEHQSLITIGQQQAADVKTAANRIAAIEVALYPKPSNPGDK